MKNGLEKIGQLKTWKMKLKAARKKIGMEIRNATLSDFDA